MYGIRKFLAAIDMFKVAVAVSGGIDSAVAACLYQEVLGAKTCCWSTCQAAYNSGTTQELAARLARNLQALYTVVPIQAAVDLTVRQVSESRSPISPRPPVQLAGLLLRSREQPGSRPVRRVLAAWRPPSAAGFTCNANKSELTVGYTTLYGDQAGFLAALADLWKHQIYAWPEYINDRRGGSLSPAVAWRSCPAPNSPASRM